MMILGTALSPVPLRVYCTAEAGRPAAGKLAYSRFNVMCRLSGRIGGSSQSSIRFRCSVPCVRLSQQVSGIRDQYCALMLAA